MNKTMEFAVPQTKEQFWPRRMICPKGHTGTDDRKYWSCIVCGSALVALPLQEAARELEVAWRRIEILENALRPFSTEFEIADAAGELQHWPPEDVPMYRAAWEVLK